MIFVTVGTHEQQFNRLIETIDRMVLNGLINERVVIQTGYSDYIPKKCEFKKIYSYSDMNRMIKEARIIVTHGGPSSFLMALKENKIPIVFPRQKEYGEHINNHQVEFSNFICENKKNIIVVNNKEELENCLLNYEKIIKNLHIELENNNIKFNKELEKIAYELIK